MNEAKHTKGCGVLVPLGYNRAFECGGAFGLCDRCELKQFKEVNADLLEACQAMVAWLDAEDKMPPDYNFHACVAACKKAEELTRAAIARATQGTP